MTLREPNLQTPSSMLLLKRVSIYFSDLVRTGVLNINYSLKTLRKEEFTAVTVDWSGNQPRRAGKSGCEPWGGVPPPNYSNPWIRLPASSSASLLAIPLKTVGESFPKLKYERSPQAPHGPQVTLTLLQVIRDLPIGLHQPHSHPVPPSNGVLRDSPNTPISRTGNCLPSWRPSSNGTPSNKAFLINPPTLRTTQSFPHCSTAESPSCETIYWKSSISPNAAKNNRKV